MTGLLTDEEFNELIGRIYEALGDHDASDVVEERAASLAAEERAEKAEKERDEARLIAQMFTQAEHRAAWITRAEKAEAALAIAEADRDIAQAGIAIVLETIGGFEDEGEDISAAIHRVVGERDKAKAALAEARKAVAHVLDKAAFKPGNFSIVPVNVHEALEDLRAALTTAAPGGGA